MVFLLYRARSGTDRHSPSLLDWALIALTIGSFGYFVVEFHSLVQRTGYYTQTDFIVALIATVVSLEATRRIMDITLPALAGVFLLYAVRSEEHTSELQSLMRISYAVFCLK